MLRRIVFFIFSFTFVFSGILVIAISFTQDNRLGEYVANILRAHHLGQPPAFFQESLIYHVMNIFSNLLQKCDEILPFFPSIVRILWWHPTTLTMLLLFPFVFLIAYLLSKNPKVGVIIFVLFCLWLMPLSKISRNSWNGLVSKYHLDISLPWSEKFVWLHEPGDQKNAYVKYQYKWQQKNKVENAEINVSCLGHYRLDLNGKRIYHGPVFGSASKVYFDTVQIGQFIRKGENILSLTCIHIEGITHEHALYPTNGLLIGGSIQDGLFAHTLADNRLWRYSVVKSLKPGERVFEAGYKEKYNLLESENFETVPEKREYNFTLHPRPVSYLQYKNLTVKKLSDGVYDLGRFATGYLTLSSHQLESCKVDLFYGVKLNDNGLPRVYMGQEDEVVFPSKVATFEQVSRRSGKYIGLTGDCDLEKIELTFTEVFYPLSVPEMPKELSELDQKIYQISLNSIRNNVQDHIEDSVDRERATYLGDTLSVSECLLVTPGNENVIKQTIRQFADSQNANGSFPSMAPSGREQFIPSYTLQWPILLDLYLQKTNDKKFAKEMWPHLKLLLSWTERRESPEGFFGNKFKEKNWWHFFDWTPTSISLTYQTQNQLWYIQSLLAASRMSEFIDENTSSYSKKADILKGNLQKYAYDKNASIYFDSFDKNKQEGVSLVTNSLAGKFGAFPDESSNERALEYFKNDYTTESPFSQTWVIDWMIEAGEKDLALHVLRSYWGQMVEDGATSVYEVYKPGKIIPDDSNQSYSHAWGCSPLYQYGRILSE